MIKFLVTLGALNIVCFLAFAVITHSVQLDNSRLRIQLADSDAREAELIQAVLEMTHKNAERIIDAEEDLRRKTTEISVIEASLSPENTRWAKVKLVRSSVQSVIKENGYVKVPDIQGLTSYSAAVVDFSEKYDVSASLILAVTTRESAFNDKAKSHVGAQGLMQIMPATAQEISQDVGERYYNIYKIRDNVHFGTWYLWKMMDRFNGDVELAVRAYNCGPTCVEKVRVGLWSSYPEETIHYHEAVLKWKEHYESLGL